jgi:hypothetical protein
MSGPHESWCVKRNFLLETLEHELPAEGTIHIGYSSKIGRRADPGQGAGRDRAERDERRGLVAAAIPVPAVPRPPRQHLQARPATRSMP